ncbi:hypothetical protein BD408DRAFT_343414, partial [Parasitella parasitica]
TDKATALLEIIRYTLTSFHPVFSNVSLLTQNHEKAPFIENIVPSFLSLSRTTGFVETQHVLKQLMKEKLRIDFE